MKKFKYVYFSFLLIALITLVACSNNDVTSPDSTDTNDDSDSTEQATQTDGHYGGELKIAMTGGGQAFAPASELRAVNDVFISGTALEKLGKYGPDGQMKPHLAKGWEENAEEGTITFELNEGIQFHDGTDFNAEAAKWNIEEFIESGRAELNGISAIEVTGEYTIKVHLEEWNSSMLNNICHFVPMASPTAYEQNGKEWLKDNPVGTGPFKFVSWAKDESVVFEKNENYWQEGKPYLDRVTFYFIPDPTTATASLRAGEINAFMGAPALSANEMEALADFNVEVLTTGLGGLGRGVIADSGNPQSPFANPLVRRAVSYAIDRDAIVDALFYGYAIATNQWGVPGSPSFNNEIGISYNPEKAKELLTEAGYPNGFNSTFTVSNVPAEIDFATAIQGYLSEVGINVELNTIDNSLFREITTSANNQPWDGLILFSHRGDHDLGTYLPRSISANATTYGHHLEQVEELESLIRQVRDAKSQAEIETLSKEIQLLLADEHALATFVLVNGLPFIIHEAFEDTGFNVGHGSEWSPENAKQTK